MALRKRNPNSAFQFPTPNSSLQSDVVFCGKLIRRQTQPSSQHAFMAQSNSCEKPKPVRSTDRSQRWATLQLPDTGNIRLQRSGGSRNYANGLFGVAKFPVQMELSDIRKRQSARSSAMMEAAACDGEPEKGEKSGLEWQLIRTLRRKSRQWLNTLSTYESWCYFVSR